MKQHIGGSRIYNMINKSIAIVGGNGFIGKNLTNHFLKKGYRLIIIDLHITEALESNENAKFHTLDIHHTNELISILQNSDYIIWLVHASIPSTIDDSLCDDFALNISPIVKFLEKANSIKSLKKFVFLSSGGTVYGNTDIKEPIREEHSLNPISNYGLSKMISEGYINYLTAKSKFESIIIRPSNVYGKYQSLVKPQGIIGFANKALKENIILDLYNGGNIIRDFIFVSDLALAIEKLIEANSNNSTTQIYNVGTMEGYSIKEVLFKIEKIAGKKLKLNHKSARNFDCEYNVLNTEKIRSEFDWAPKVSLEEGLRVVWEWIKG